MNRPKQNVTFFLSASVPNREGWIEGDRRAAATRIGAAIENCTHRILYVGGNLVLGGHPAITPYILSGVRKYVDTDSSSGDVRNRTRITIYQSEAFPAAVRPEATRQLGEEFARIVDVPAEKGETFIPGLVGKREQFHRSLARMRKKMLTEDAPITAMILIGGMEGAVRECYAFQEYCKGRKIYYFDSTGGAARQIAELTHNKIGMRQAFGDEEFFKPDAEPLPLVRAEAYVKSRSPLTKQFPPYLSMVTNIINEVAGESRWD